MTTLTLSRGVRLSAEKVSAAGGNTVLEILECVFVRNWDAIF